MRCRYCADVAANPRPHPFFRFGIGMWDLLYTCPDCNTCWWQRITPESHWMIVEPAVRDAIQAGELVTIDGEGRLLPTGHFQWPAPIRPDTAVARPGDSPCLKR